MGAVGFSVDVGQADFQLSRFDESVAAFQIFHVVIYHRVALRFVGAALGVNGRILEVNDCQFKKRWGPALLLRWPNGGNCCFVVSHGL